MNWLLRGCANALTEIRTHRLRSLVSVSGVTLAVATFAVIVQLGDAGRSGIEEVVERTQGRQATYAIDVSGPANARTVTRWLATARGPHELRVDLVPFFRLGDVELEISPGGPPVVVTLVATDRHIVDVLPRPLVAGTWWDDRPGRLDVPLVLPEPVAAEIAVLTGTTTAGLVGAPLPLAHTGMSARVVGVAPASALERFAGTGAFGLAPMESLAAIPAELLDLGGTGRMLLVTDPAGGRQRAATAAARLLRTAAIRGDRGPAVDVTRVDESAAFAGATRALEVLLAGIAVIALVVGALGIMNISMTSLGARVGEFGLRRAVGASPGDVFVMVVTESALLGLAGGAAGVAVAAAVSTLAGPAVAAALQIPFGPLRAPVAITGVLASLAAGIAAGVVPATVARRMPVLDALRSS